MLSGDFCCANGSAIAYDDPAILQRALAAMQHRFCVVGLTERLADTLAYLRFVLGLPQEGAPAYPTPPLPPPAPLGPLRPARPPTAASEHTRGRAADASQHQQRSLLQQVQAHGEARTQTVEAHATQAQQGPPSPQPAGSRRFVLAPSGRSYGPVEPGVARALLGANGLDVALYGAAEERFRQQMEAMGRAGRGRGPAGAGEEVHGVAAGGQQAAGAGQAGRGGPTGGQGP